MKNKLLVELGIVVTVIVLCVIFAFLAFFAFFRDLWNLGKRLAREILEEENGGFYRYRDEDLQRLQFGLATKKQIKTLKKMKIM